MDEMNEIAEFMQQLDPNIEVIWGTSTDNSLNKDAKVIILAAAMSHEMEVSNAEKSLSIQDDGYYDALMHQLYETPKAAVRTIIEPEMEFQEDEDKKEGADETTSPPDDPLPPQRKTFVEKALDWLYNLTNP